MGVRQALERGVIAGFAVTDAKVTLLDGKFHEVDSAAMDFEIAGSIAAREAVRKAKPALLEPIMSVTLNVNETHLGNVVADLGRRRGSVDRVTVRGSVRNIHGQIPLGEAFGYATALRSMTSGRGSFSLEFDHYDKLPDSLAEQVIKERKEAGKISERG